MHDNFDQPHAKSAREGDYDILKLVHDTHRNEIKFHRDVMNKLFQWTSSVYLAIGGGIIAIGHDRWAAYGIYGKIFVSVSVLLIGFFFVRQSLHCVDAINSNARVIVKTDTLLHLFDQDYFESGESIYPYSWQGWGTNKKGAGYYERLNITIMTSLALAILIFTWIT